MKPPPKPASPAQLRALAARAPTFVLSDADRARLVKAAREDAPAESRCAVCAWPAGGSVCASCAAKHPEGVCTCTGNRTPGDGAVGAGLRTSPGIHHVIRCPMRHARPSASIVGTDAWREQRAATVARERRAIAAKLDQLERLAAELGYTVIRGRKA